MHFINNLSGFWRLFFFSSPDLFPLCPRSISAPFTFSSHLFFSFLPLARLSDAPHRFSESAVWCGGKVCVSSRRDGPEVWHMSAWIPLARPRRLQVSSTRSHQHRCADISRHETHKNKANIKRITKNLGGGEEVKRNKEVTRTQT